MQPVGGAHPSCLPIQSYADVDVYAHGMSLSCIGTVLHSSFVMPCLNEPFKHAGHDIGLDAATTSLFFNLAVHFMSLERACMPCLRPRNRLVLTWGLLACCRHHYNRSTRPNVWGDIPGWYERQAHGNARVRYMLGLQQDPPEGQALASLDYYGMGSKRSLSNYWQYAGLDILQKKTWTREKYCS